MRVAPDRPDHSANVGIALSQNSVTAATAATVTLYSADGLIAVQEEHNGVIADVPQLGNSVGDDDLTSLTWLQDKNLLKSVHELPKHEFVDDNANDLIVSNSSASSSSSHKPSNQIISVVPRMSYDPQVHVNSKPPFSFSCLIFMAIEDSENKALPVKDIYVWILNHFPYYCNAPTGWKNSVRHNLSLNKCFRKVDKSPNLGKGSLWMVEQRFRPCLIQALQKTPYHQYHKFIRNFNGKKGTDDETVEICDKEITVRKPFAQIECSDLSSSNDVSSTSQQTSQTEFVKENLADDVDAAATAMLVLKHGACAFDIKTENVDFVVRDENVSSGVYKTEIDEKPAFANCPNEDHDYGYHQYTSDISEEDKGTTNSLYWITVKEDIEEQRKIAEGADALLNLAGITTCGTRKRSLSSSSGNQKNAKQLRVDEAQFTHRGGMLLRKDKNTEVNFKGSINVSSATDSVFNKTNNCYTNSSSSSSSSYSSTSSSSSKNNHNDSGMLLLEEKSKRSNRNGSNSSRRLYKKIKKR